MDSKDTQSQLLNIFDINRVEKGGVFVSFDLNSNEEKQFKPKIFIVREIFINTGRIHYSSTEEFDSILEEDRDIFLKKSIPLEMFLLLSKPKETIPKQKSDTAQKKRINVRKKIMKFGSSILGK